MVLWSGVHCELILKNTAINLTYCPFKSRAKIQFIRFLCATLSCFCGWFVKCAQHELSIRGALPRYSGENVQYCQTRECDAGEPGTC